MAFATFINKVVCALGVSTGAHVLNRNDNLQNLKVCTCRTDLWTAVILEFIVIDEFPPKIKYYLGKFPMGS